MLTVGDIKKAIADKDFEFYGIRVDDGIRYNIGNTANNSHQLFQDADFDDDGELIYPYIEDGIYKGFYDGGELDGTCTIGFDAEDDASIQKAIDLVSIYFGDFIHVLGGYYSEFGLDEGELIIRDAEVLGAFEERDR